MPNELANAKHTPGAERAAEQIALDSPEATDANLGGMIARFAEIIDRETGCRDMLAALEAAERYWDDMTRDGGTQGPLPQEIIEAYAHRLNYLRSTIAAALAKGRGL